MHIQEAINKYKMIESGLMQEGRSDPEPKEIAKIAGWTRKKAEEVKFYKDLHVFNLFDFLTEDGEPYGMIFIDQNSPDPFYEAALLELSGLVEQALDYFTPREKEIIEARFGSGKEARRYTLEEVGQRFGITRERIRQLENKILKKLKIRLRKKFGDIESAMLHEYD